MAAGPEAAASPEPSLGASQEADAVASSPEPSPEPTFEATPAASPQPKAETEQAKEPESATENASERESEPASEPAAEKAAEPTIEPVAETAAEDASAAIAEEAIGLDLEGTEVGADGCLYTFEEASGGVLVNRIDDCLDVVVPAELGGQAVVEIGDGQPLLLKAPFTSVEVPDSVATIADRAFENAADLAEIDLGAVRHVGKLAFSGTAARFLRTPQTLTSAGDSSFGNMTKLTTVQVMGDLHAFDRLNFVNDTALRTVSVLGRSTLPLQNGNTAMFRSLDLSMVFHDGTHGLDCRSDAPLAFGGGTVDAKCLFDVKFDGGPMQEDSPLESIPEGVRFDSAPFEPLGPAGMYFAGWEPALPHVVTDDTTFIPQFRAPSEEELIADKQGGFTVPGEVTAGDELLISWPREPNPSGTSEPNPTGPAGPPDADETPDVFLFSEPVQLEVVSFTGHELTAQVPEDFEPGQHSVAVYSRSGDVLGWQPITVVAAEGTDEGDTDGGSGSGSDDESGPGDEAAGASDDASGNAGVGGEDASGSAGGDGAAEVASSDAQADGDTSAELASTGSPSVALTLAGALALASAGALLVARRRA